MPTIRRRKRKDASPVVSESADPPESRDTVSTMIDTADAITARLETQLKELHDVLRPVLPLFEEVVEEAAAEPTTEPRAVGQLHHLCDRLNVISTKLGLLIRDAAV